MPCYAYCACCTTLCLAVPTASGVPHCAILRQLCHVAPSCAKQCLPYQLHPTALAALAAPHSDKLCRLRCGAPSHATLCRSLVSERRSRQSTYELAKSKQPPCVCFPCPPPPCCAMLCLLPNALLCCAELRLLRHAVPYYATLRHAAPCSAMLRQLFHVAHAEPHSASLRHAVPYKGQLRQAVPSCAILRQTTP